MSNHVALTDDERREVATFWADYFREGGTGRQPSAFQLDAVNDPDVRDAFLFWQIDADPTDFNPGFSQRTKALSLIETFGAAPTPSNVTLALLRLINDKNQAGVELEDLDTASVWTVAHLMWLLLGGDWANAMREATALSEVVVQYLYTFPEEDFPHRDPVSGIGIAVAMLGTLAKRDEEKALEMSAKIFGFTADTPNTKFARAVVTGRKVKNNAAA